MGEKVTVELRTSSLLSAPPVEFEVPEPKESARAAGLRYQSDDAPGIRRAKSGRGFSYRQPDGALVRDRRVLERIRQLAIPPAWQDVWISPLANGHLQATGRDARGRKQYRYHADWRTIRDETKFSRLIAFAEALPALRVRVEEDLGGRGLSRERVLATVVRLLETTLIRVGNEEYVRENNSYGLTTLRTRHVDIAGNTLRFSFRGKSGKDHSVELHDRRLARIVHQCRDLPGHELFQYLDEDGARQAVTSEDVNDYLRQATGESFSAKDFRTWGGTVLALAFLAAQTASEGAPRSVVVEMFKQVAAQLGNRPAVCRKYYVHPAVTETYLNGRLGELVPAAAFESGLEDATLLLLRSATDVAIEAPRRPHRRRPSSLAN
jgi:DNA topoisomerase-1